MKLILSVPFSETNLFSKLILDYIEENKNTGAFYKYELSSTAIPEIIEDKKKENIDRKILVSAIRSQYASMDIHKSVNENIESLSKENSFCIVTAHQLNIFTGPLYFIYKIAAAIATCKQLKSKFPENDFVPIYWMGSEDHDFDEINHIVLYNKKLEWKDFQGGAIGEYSPDSILPLLDELKTILGAGMNTDELYSIFKNAYSQDSLSDATRYLVNELFGSHGLVIVDGNDTVFKHRFSEVMKDELLHQHSVKLVEEQLMLLDQNGYKQQAHPRAINLFYLQKKQRNRIVFEDGSFVIHDTILKFSQKEILDELELHPERFSPNVILRPLFQQMILPSLAYIGGAGELSYWMQLKKVFDFYNVNFPQLLLRNSILLINKNTSVKMQKLGIGIHNIFLDSEQLKKNYVFSNTEEDIDVNVFKQEIEKTFNSFQVVVKNVDASLENTVGAELQKSLQGIDSIQKKLMKSLKQKNETELNQIEKIRSQLFPDQSLQERVENFSPYYLQHGQFFIDNLIEQMDVYNKQFLIISE